jgi:hypothetical protein
VPDAYLRRLERLAEHDPSAAVQLARARDRLTPPWSFDPRRDPVRRLAAASPWRGTRQVWRERFGYRAVGVWTAARHNGEGVRFECPACGGTGAIPGTAYEEDCEACAGDGHVAWPKDRVLLCWERPPLIYRMRTNLMGYPPPPVPAPFGAPRLWTMRMAGSPRMRVYAALRALELHEVRCEWCRTLAPAHCEEYRLLAASWRTANWNSHRGAGSPVFPVPGAWGDAPQCARCYMPSDDWPAKPCPKAW